MAKKTILVVDDIESIRDLLEDFLTMFGYNPIICENGEHAIPHISSADLLITDFNMPRMNGAELTKIVKRGKPDMPVIIITAAPENIPIDHLADKVIEKPFGIEQLREAIADLLKKEGRLS